MDNAKRQAECAEGRDAPREGGEHLMGENGHAIKVGNLTSWQTFLSRRTDEMAAASTPASDDIDMSRAGAVNAEYNDSAVVAPPARVAAGAPVDAAAYKALYERSIRDPRGFWGDMARDTLHWFRAPTEVCVRRARDAVTPRAPPARARSPCPPLCPPTASTAPSRRVTSGGSPTAS